MTTAIQIAQMLAIIAGLVAVVGALLYAFSWAMIRLVLFFPAIGKKHRHSQWNALTKRSGRQ